MTTKLTHRYAFTLSKMGKAIGRNEYMDLAKEANLLWHQMERKKSKDHPRINCRAQSPTQGLIEPYMSPQ